MERNDIIVQPLVLQLQRIMNLHHVNDTFFLKPHIVHPQAIDNKASNTLFLGLNHDSLIFKRSHVEMLDFLLPKSRPYEREDELLFCHLSKRKDKKKAIIRQIGPI